MCSTSSSSASPHSSKRFDELAARISKIEHRLHIDDSPFCPTAPSSSSCARTSSPAVSKDLLHIEATACFNLFSDDEQESQAVVPHDILPNDFPNDDFQALLPHDSFPNANFPVDLPNSVPNDNFPDDNVPNDGVPNNFPYDSFPDNLPNNVPNDNFPEAIRRAVSALYDLAEASALVDEIFAGVDDPSAAFVGFCVDLETDRSFIKPAISEHLDQMECLKLLGGG